jgi:hypothetical protein
MRAARATPRFACAHLLLQAERVHAANPLTVHIHSTPVVRRVEVNHSLHTRRVRRGERGDLVTRYRMADRRTKLPPSPHGF